jgi:ketosteroid isomerase-like protein
VLRVDNNQKEQAMAEADIQKRVEDWAKAIRAKDLDVIMSFYTSDIVSFDLDPPLRYAGTENRRRAWKELFAAHSGPLSVPADVKHGQAVLNLTP